jgi:hypothetical protein
MIRCIQRTDSKTTCELSEDLSVKPADPLPETHTEQSKNYFSLLPEYSILLSKAWEVGSKAKNPSVAKQARSLILVLQNTINAFEKLGFEVGTAPSLKAYEAEDESILIEWIYPNFRIGFTIEPNPRESGWYLVANEKIGNRRASGHLLWSNLEKNFLWLLNFIITYR